MVVATKEIGVNFIFIIYLTSSSSETFCSVRTPTLLLSSVKPSILTLNRYTNIRILIVFRLFSSSYNLSSKLYSNYN